MLMLELLAPAGSMEALRAAVQNGADAVYLGCGSFNARQSAKNFTPQTLVEAVKYCHVRGVAVHLTLNTLVSDKEEAQVCDLIRHAAVSGVDAFIVQDLGVVELCRRIAPSVPVHGSTQMTGLSAASPPGELRKDSGIHGRYPGTWEKEVAKSLIFPFLTVIIWQLHKEMYPSG